MNTFVNNHKPIKLLYEPDKPIRFVIVTLYSSFYDEYIKTKFPDDPINLVDAVNHTNLNCNTAEISLIFRQIKQKMLSNINNRIYYESKVGEIISIIVNNANQYTMNKKLSNKLLNSQDINNLTQVAHLLDNSMITKPTIEELSKTAKMSSTKLKSSFKAMYNITIGQYSINARLKHSLILLANSEENISDIALAVGYKNASKFSKTFFKVFGLYPKDYRKSLKI